VGNSCSTQDVKAAESSVPSSRTPRHAVLLAVGLLAVAALAAYRNTLLAPFVLDDADAITENPTIHHLWPPWRAFAPPGGGATVSGRPVLNFSFAVNYALSGEAVWSYHALNLVIHLLAACTLFGVVRRTLGLRPGKGQGVMGKVISEGELGEVGRGRSPTLFELGRTGRVPPEPPSAGYGDPARQSDATFLAFAIAVLWLLHPLQTEAVTYVSQRAESLAGLFCLLTLYGFIRATEADAGRNPIETTKAPRNQAGDSQGKTSLASLRLGRSKKWPTLAIVACLLGVATKEVAATTPLLVFLYDRTFVAGTFREAWRRRRWLHLSLAATWVPLALLVAGTGWNRGGTVGFNAGVAPWAYWLTQFVAVAHYVKQALWPHPLIFDYGTFWVEFREAAPFALIVLPLAAATVVALWRRPAAGFLGAWFFVILAPTSVVPGTNQMIVEHRLYLPLAAVVVLAVTGLHAVLGRRSLLLWPVLAVGLGWLTFVRNGTYGSELALWRDTAAKAPRNPRAWYNLGIVYSEQGRYAEAVAPDEAAVRLADSKTFAADAPAFHNKLGYDLAELGRVPEAVAQFEQTLHLKPDYGLAHFNLARALVRLERYPEAIRHYEAALRLQTGGADTEAELSDALLHAGRLEEAIAHCRAALQLTPAWAPGYNNLGYALLLAGRADEAIAAYRNAVRLDPRYAAAWVGLGYALIQAGRPAEAVAPCTEAVKLQPGFADAHNTLGIALAQTGRTADAIASFEQALRFGAGGADVHNNLGNALDAAGRPAEAIAQYREALRLDPDYAPAHRNLGEELRRAGREAEAAEQFAAAARLEAAGGSRLPPRPSGRTPAGE